jgi:hypothetical protein
MKHFICFIIFLFCAGLCVQAQDEGTIVKQSRLEKGKGVFIGIGPSFTLGKNIGDYSTGFNFDAGYMIRLNRVISIGPSISYVSFNYDPQKTGLNNIFFSEETFSGSYYYRTALVVDFKGGDLSLTSAALNIKFNLIPVMNNTKISVYGFAKPFIAYATRSEVSGNASIFNIYDTNDDGNYSEAEIVSGYQSAITLPWRANDPQWASYGVRISDDLKKDSRVTGGIFVGPGIEFFPAKKFSFYAQAAFGYTFPVTFVSTKKYEGGDLDKIDEKFPIIKQGFPSVNIQLGASFNF